MGKNSPTWNLQTKQSPRESPFTDKIDIPKFEHVSTLIYTGNNKNKSCG
jgi:hypothetical protein